MSLAPFLPVTTLGRPGLGKQWQGTPYTTKALGAFPAASALPQITTINVTGATNNETYSVRIVGADEWGNTVDTTVQASTDGSTSQTELRDALIAAINADSVFGFLATPEADTNAIVLTGTRVGADYTFTVSFPLNPSTQLTQTATQAAATATTYRYGRFVRKTGQNGLNPIVGPPAAITPAGITYGVTHGAGATYSGSLLLGNKLTGAVVQVDWTAAAGGSLAATLTAINSAIGTALTTAGITGATVTTASPNVVVALPLYVTSLISLSSDASGGGGSPAMTVAVTLPGALTDYYLIRDSGDYLPIRGQDPATIIAVDGRPVPLPIVSGSGSGVWGVEIASGASITAGDPVYIETASGANNGRATPTPSPTAALLTLDGQICRWFGADTLNPALAGVTL